VRVQVLAKPFWGKKIQLKDTKIARLGLKHVTWDL